jgi:hypothetical protein
MDLIAVSYYSHGTKAALISVGLPLIDAFMTLVALQRA